jgi:dTDP-4-amino-4,6-dideoxygalactose transaminase
MSFDSIKQFEEKIAEFFGAPYAVAVDCCTHGIEICLIHLNVKKIIVPTRTYISIPFLAKKLNLKLEWSENEWQDYYYLHENIIDAAVLWRSNSYISNKFMCISFQFRKHLNLGRGGVILCPDRISYEKLKSMSYDGRNPNIPWRDQNIEEYGLHYYMTPETANLGLKKLQDAINTPPKKWTIDDWPDISKMNVFKNLNNKI